MPAGLAILLCHAAAIPLAISDSIMGQYCPQKYANTALNSLHGLMHSPG